jgi:hypothetical protein
MAALVSMLPSFLKRRKRSADEEEAHELRSALEAAGRATAIDKCMELRAANKALSQRVAELERAAGAQGEAAAAAMRAVVRDELARAAKVPRWTFCAEGASLVTCDDDDSSGDFDTGTEDSGDETSLDSWWSRVAEDASADALMALLSEPLQSEDEEVKAAARARLLALLRSPNKEVQAAARAQLLTSLHQEDDAAQAAAERERLQAISGEEL